MNQSEWKEQSKELLSDVQRRLVKYLVPDERESEREYMLSVYVCVCVCVCVRKREREREKGREEWQKLAPIQ